MATPKILIVEDEAVTRNTLRGIFEAEGYEVLQAQDGAEMYRQLNSETVNLIVLDINLPGKNGLLLGRELREKAAIPLIFLLVYCIFCFVYLIEMLYNKVSVSFILLLNFFVISIDMDEITFFKILCNLCLFSIDITIDIFFLFFSRFSHLSEKCKVCNCCCKFGRC